MRYPRVPPTPAAAQVRRRSSFQARPIVAIEIRRDAQESTSFVRDTVVDPEVLGAQELAAIEAEAAGLDLDGAAALAFDALDRVASAG